jgi:hypothetical protein
MPPIGDQADAVFGGELLHVSLDQVGVEFDLVDRWHGGGVLEERPEVLDHEVADRAPEVR